MTNTLQKIGSTFDTSQTVHGQAFHSVLCQDGSTGLGTIWGVNLCAWQNPGAPNRNSTKLNLDTCRVSIIVGADGATETFVVDYPAAGTAFAVAGQTIRVEVAGVVPAVLTAGLPIVGAYLTKASGTNRRMSATLTDPTVAIGAGLGFQFNVPVRARAYRLMGNDPTPAATTMLQLAGDDGIGLTRDVGLDVNSIGVGPSDRSQWFPLHPDAQFLVITNNQASAISVGVQWQLETLA